MLHCENIEQVVDDTINKYNLQQGNFDIFDLDEYLYPKPPTALQMGKVYKYLIIDTEEKRPKGQPDENYVEGILRVYNHPICEVIYNYNCSAYYESYYILVDAYNHNG